MQKLTFNRKPILFTLVVDTNNNEIATISYPMVTTTKSTLGTDSGRTGIWIGKKVLDGAIIKTKEGTAALYRTYLTENQFLNNNYKVTLEIEGNEVFSCTQHKNFSLYGPYLTFKIEHKEYLLKRVKLFPFKIKLTANDKDVGLFTNTHIFSVLPSITFEGFERLSDVNIIYLYAILSRYF